MAADNSISVRVYLEDTDAGGVVFYANYLKFFERARTELVRKHGFEMRRSLSEGISYVVSSLALDYKQSAFLDDALRVYVELIVLKKCYFEVRQWVCREGCSDERLVEGTVKVACVDLDTGKPRVMPDELREALTALNANI